MRVRLSVNDLDYAGAQGNNLMQAGFLDPDQARDSDILSQDKGNPRKKLSQRLPQGLKDF